VLQRYKIVKPYRQKEDPITQCVRGVWRRRKNSTKTNAITLITVYPCHRSLYIRTAQAIQITFLTATVVYRPVWRAAAS